MNISIGRYIYDALKSIQGLTVYPVVAAFDNPNPTTPFAVYQRTSMAPQYTKSLFTGDISHNYSVTVADNEYDSTVNLIQQAIDTLTSLSCTEHDGIKFNQVTVTDLSEDFLDGIFLQTLQIQINTTQL